jgi:hypothetical protein
MVMVSPNSHQIRISIIPYEWIDIEAEWIEEINLLIFSTLWNGKSQQDSQPWRKGQFDTDQPSVTPIDDRWVFPLLGEQGCIG